MTPRSLRPAESIYQTISQRNSAPLRPERAEAAIEDDENAAEIRVQVLRIRRVMYAMMRRGVQHWLLTAEIPEEWLVLSWRIAGPRAPMAAVLVLAAAALLALGAAAFSARVRLEIGSAEPRAFAAHTVRHALLNLVQNALEYGLPPVVVRATAPPGEIRLDVIDHGAGLSESEWRLALRPFQRLGDRPSGTHTGLGLAMIDRLVSVGGGSIVAARTVDGFLVTVRLPAEGIRPETSPDPQRT